MKYIYYPGCSLKGTGRAYEESLLPVLKALDVDFEELKEWNCCGATAYMAVDETKAFALAARNLALAEEIGSGEPGVPPTIIAPCNACFLVLNKAKHYIAENAELGKKIKTALKAADLNFKGNVLVRHPIDVLVNDIGLDKIKTRATKPLKGLKVAPYYGCQIVRPYADFDDQHNPVTLDKILKAIGVEVVDYPLKTKCCGGSLTGTITEVGVRLNYMLLKEARRRDADCIATTCPLCQFNLECYQDKMHYENEPAMNMPVAYFTQLMGLAFDIPKEQLGFNHIFHQPAPAMAK
jgi:heterodisulfide reductase subunit B2